jgi:hypothetical protein
MCAQIQIDVPEFVRAPRKATMRHHGVLVYGHEGTGKTYFLLSVLDWLTLVKGLKVEDLCIRIIDTDHAVEKILDHFDDEYRKCIKISYPKSFDDIEQTLEGTKDGWPGWIHECKEWQEQKVKELGPVGIYSAWILCDTIAGWWDGSTGAQEWYSQAARNMSLTEIKMDSDERLDPRDDYKVINPKHNYLADKLKASEVNFVWTAPAKDVYGEGREKYKKLAKKPAGQKGNPFRVDNMIYLYSDPDKHMVWAYLEKSRDVLHLYGGTLADKNSASHEEKEKMVIVPWVTYIKHMQALDKCRDIDHQEKLKMQKRQKEKLKAKGLYREGVKEVELEEMVKTEGIEAEPEKKEPDFISKPATAPEPATSEAELDISF